MKVLIVKTSSMGDVIHTLPAITDAANAKSDIQFDWLVEEAFAAIPQWHQAVNHVIPVAWRRLRKKKIGLLFNKEWREFKKQLNMRHYDLIIDAQGLLKSAWLSSLVKGTRVGFDKASARESLACWFYQRKIKVNKNQHAIQRIRQLFAKALDYQFDDSVIDYGIDVNNVPFPNLPIPKNYSIFILNTTWITKHWPEKYWLQLITLMQQNNQQVVIPGGYHEEQLRIKKTFGHCENVTITENTNLQQMLQILAHANAIVSVDTGLSHLAAALNKPTITLYGPTNANEIGTIGQQQIHLSVQFPCAPCKQKLCSYTGVSQVKPACFATLPASLVWQKLAKLIAIKSDTAR